MNEKEYFKANDDGIGIDPTMMPVIESLDVLPAETKPEEKANGKKNKKKEGKMPTPNPDKKPRDLIKKILFTVVVLLLMAGVSFGVYYYLSLGTSGGGKSKFSLQDKVVFVGEQLPHNVIEYGDFSTVDVSECSLDILDVDVNTVGEYAYSVVCGKVKYTAKIIVKEKVTFDIEANIVYKVTDSQAEASEFISADKDGYSYEFIDQNVVNEYLASTGGPYVVNIKVTNEKAEELVISTLLYVINEKANLYLTCNSGKYSANGYAFTITDKIAFNADRNNLGVSVRSYNYVFESDSDYETMKNEIVDGKIKINDHEGFALIDNINRKIKIVNILSNETLDEEYGGSLSSKYSDINSYYRNTKRYSCSI